MKWPLFPVSPGAEIDLAPSGKAVTPVFINHESANKSKSENEMASDKVITLSEDNFETEVLKSDLPILVDFWAQWCGPCRMVAPVLDELADEMDGTVRFGKLNVDENQGIAYQYQVSSIPTFILFKGGQMADRMMGAMPRSAFQRFIDRNL